MLRALTVRKYLVQHIERFSLGLRRARRTTALFLNTSPCSGGLLLFGSRQYECHGAWDAGFGSFSGFDTCTATATAGRIQKQMGVLTLRTFPLGESRSLYGAERDETNTRGERRKRGSRSQTICQHNRRRCRFEHLD